MASRRERKAGNGFTPFLANVEDVKVGHLVHFTPGSLLAPDRVLRVHLRWSDFMGDFVTVTHARGCWSKRLGEKVEVVGRMLDATTKED